MKIAIIGLGEAGHHFANDLVDLGFEVSGWDPKLRYHLNTQVQFASHNKEAVEDADIIFSVNETSESRGIADEVRNVLKRDALYCEMNTSSPQTKKEIEEILEPAAIQFVDLAIMAPVPPKGIQVPLLASGPGAKTLQGLFNSYSVTINYLNDQTGDAAGRKLLRSIVYKGVAAVICEAMEAAESFELEDYMRAQIHSIIGENDALIDRFTYGSRKHAKRRMHEMEAVVNMLESEDLKAIMSNGSREKLKTYLNKNA